MMYLKEIVYGTPEHEEMIALRNKVLREPLGLIFSEEDLLKEKNDYLLGCFLPSTDKIVGCCVLTPMNDNTIILRQMAVDSGYQKMGVGGEILTFTEELAGKKNFRYIYLHARKEAVGFYKKYGYEVESDEFIEVGIPHFEMLKNIE